MLKFVLLLLDCGVTLLTVSVSGVCSFSLFLIQNPKCFVLLGYVGRWKSHEELHTAPDPPLDVLPYNFTASYGGLQWTLYIEHVTVSDIIVMY